MESEQRRREMSRIYNSYTAARSKYSIEDIPMPDSLEGSWFVFVFFIAATFTGMLSFCVGWLALVRDCV